MNLTCDFLSYGFALWKHLIRSTVIYNIPLVWPHQANNLNLTRKEGEMWNISIQALLHLAVITLVAVIFHFMYIQTIPSDMKLLKHVSDWALSKHMCVCVYIHRCLFQESSISKAFPCCSRFGLLDSGVRLGESSCDVRGDKHSIKTGSSGPPKTTKMHHYALCVLWDVSGTHW